MDRKLIEEFDKKQKSLKNRRNKDSSNLSSSKTKQPKIEKSEIVQPSTSYRDRAQERREGLNKDFELDPDDLRISNPTIENTRFDDDNIDTVDEEERRRQQIEDSKYLGGDVEHTHLVKGLDFALLEKVKNDQKLEEKLAGDKSNDRELMFGDVDSDSEEEEFRNEAILAASSASNSKRQIVDIEKLKKGQSTEIIPCRTALARRLLNVMEEKWPEKSELFLPGRMSYIIPIDGDGEDNTVTTILRSKADASVQDESGLPNESDFALDQLVNILTRIRRGETNSELTKKQRNWERDDGTNDYNY